MKRDRKVVTLSLKAAHALRHTRRSDQRKNK
jgi:hypothetical protein